MAENFYTILTNVGLAKFANSQVSGNKINLTETAVGDGNGSYYNPNSNQTELRNEVWRGNVASIDIDEKNSNWIVIETVIPSENGGFMVREVGIFDDEGDMIAIGKYPETFKPILDQGSAKDLYIRMIIEVSNSSSVTLRIDPSVIIATKKYVDDKHQAGKEYTDGKITTLGQAVSQNTTNITNLGTEVSEHKTELAQHKLKENVHGIGDKSALLTTDKSTIVGAMNELFTFANDGKNDWATVVGLPLLPSDSFIQMKSKTQTIKNELALNLTNKGQNSLGTESLQSLVNKVERVSNIIKIPVGFSESSKHYLVGIDNQYTYWLSRGDNKLYKYTLNGTLVQTVNTLQNLDGVGHLAGATKTVYVVTRRIGEVYTKVYNYNNTLLYSLLNSDLANSAVNDKNVIYDEATQKFCYISNARQSSHCRIYNSTGSILASLFNFEGVENYLYFNKNNKVVSSESSISVDLSQNLITKNNYPSVLGTEF